MVPWLDARVQQKRLTPAVLRDLMALLMLQLRCAQIDATATFRLTTEKMAKADHFEPDFDGFFC